VCGQGGGFAFLGGKNLNPSNTSIPIQSDNKKIFFVGLLLVKDPPIIKKKSGNEVKEKTVI
jgi:hypothetical protein